MMQKLVGKLVVLRLNGERAAEPDPWKRRDLQQIHGKGIDFIIGVEETQWAYVFAYARYGYP